MCTRGRTSSAPGGGAQQLVDAAAQHQPLEIPQGNHVDNMLGQVSAVSHQIFEGRASFGHMRQLQYDQAHTAGAGFGIDDAHMDIRIGFPQFAVIISARLQQPESTEEKAT